MLARHRRTARWSALPSLPALPALLTIVLAMVLVAGVLAVGRPDPVAPAASPVAADPARDGVVRARPAERLGTPATLSAPVARATPSTAPAVATPAARRSGRPVSRRASRRPATTPARSWSGYAFDACRAPRQRVMDRWLTASPFVGVGIYLGGIHRACEQRHLTRSWVARQRAAGWNLMSIWVGPQASCTGYDHRISPRPGASGRYRAARADGARQARRAAAAARRLGLPRGNVLFYDIEPYSTRSRHCRGSSLAFLEEWTRGVHRRGYRSGVYSHVNAAVSLLSRTPRSYARPDAYWYAWITRAGRSPHRYVRNPASMRARHVHQYRLDTGVRFGGVRMAIDWNHVTLGTSALRSAAAPCGRLADRTRPRALATGQRGRAVQAVECLLGAAGRLRTRPDTTYDVRTERAVRRYQASRGLRATGAIDRRTWTSLVATGPTPLLKGGTTGEPVRRLQRGLNAAMGRRVRVDGAFGPATARAVRRYQRKVGLRPTSVVTRGTWSALARGKVTLGSTRLARR